MPHWGMRRLPLVAIVAALGTAALARPEPGSRAVWADWVGDWHGQLRWTSCVLEGEPEATLPVDAVDGKVTIDLAPAGMGFGSISLAEDDRGWIGRRDDITVHLVPRPPGLELAIELRSGCEVHARLIRSTVGIAACDRLAGWARIEQRCTRLGRPPLEQPARLVQQQASWRGARADRRGELAAQCDARAGKVEAELVDAGCAPNPDPAIGLRGAECAAMRQVAGRIARCTRLPEDVRALFARDAGDLADAARKADPARLPAYDLQCRRLREQLVAEAAHASCPP